MLHAVSNSTSYMHQNSPTPLTGYNQTKFNPGSVRLVQFVHGTARAFLVFGWMVPLGKGCFLFSVLRERRSSGSGLAS